MEAMGFRLLVVLFVFFTVSTEAGPVVALSTRCRCPFINVHSSVGIKPDPTLLSYEVGAKFEIYCYQSRELVPTVQSTTVVQCQEDCTWSQDISKIECVERQCHRLEEDDLPPNVTVQYMHATDSGSLECGALAVFDCPEGFEFQGQRFWSCGCSGTGGWTSDVFPECTEKTCEALSSPANAYCQITNDINELGTVTECLCGPEFHSVNGSGIFVCDVIDTDGNVDWVGNLQCSSRAEPDHCREPRSYEYSIMIASISGSTYPVGTVLKYVCLPGTVIVGSNVVMCNKSGQWSPDPPRCAVAECKHPAFRDESVRVMGDTKKSYLYGTRQTYTCLPGYYLLGSAVRQCIGVDQWSGYEPKCKKLCPDPGIPVDSTRTVHGPFYEGSKIVYQCGKGRVLNGSRQITCKATGLWTDSIPSCRHVECRKPTVSDTRVEQRTPVYYSYWHYAVIQYACPRGYEISGSKQRKCLKRGWSGQEPSCKKPE